MSYKYERLINLLKEQIKERASSGTFKLPTEQEICRTYGVSRQTVRKALSFLEQEHLIEKRQGSGSYATGLHSSPADNTIAILTSYDDTYIYPALLSQIKNTWKRRNYLVTVHTTRHQIFRERELLEMLLCAPPRGLLVEGTGTALPSPNLDLYERLTACGTAILFFHNAPTGSHDALCIRSDDYQGGYQLGMYLHQQGHTRIAGLFNGDELQGRDRYHGWISAMRDAHLRNADPHIAWFGGHELRELRRRQDTGFLTDFIAKHLRPCSAVICHNDEIAYWLSRELSYAGYNIPEHISIVSFDNSYLSTLNAVPLTTMSLEKQEPAQSICSTLFRMMNGLPASSQTLPWKLTERASVSPYTTKNGPA